MDGRPVDAKTYEVKLNGGTPLDKEVPLDYAVHTPTSASIWDAVRNTNKVPHLTVRLWKLSSSMNAKTKCVLIMKSFTSHSNVANCPHL